MVKVRAEEEKVAAVDSNYAAVYGYSDPPPKYSSGSLPSLTISPSPPCLEKSHVQNPTISHSPSHTQSSLFFPIRASKSALPEIKYQMGDRFYDDLLTALSSYDRRDFDINDEEQEMEGDYEDEEVNDAESVGKSDELACPFCTEDFDVLGLCCHIDADHRLEVKPGICPLCASKVTINMASHVIMQHENVLKALCNKKHGSGRSRSAVFLLRKELQEKHLCFIKESPCVVSSSEAEADSMLLSFVNNPHADYRPRTVQAGSSAETRLLAKSCDNDSSERIQPSVSTDRNNGRVRCDFLQGLVLSTILDDL